MEPDDGHTSAAQEARQGGRIAFATDAVPPPERFDRWRALFPGIDMDLPAGTDRLGFAGAMCGIAGARGVAFGWSRSTANIGCFGRHEREMVILSETGSGAVQVVRGRNEALVRRGSGMIIMAADAAAHTIVGSGGHGHRMLALPRDLLVAALGGDPLDPRLPVRPIGDVSLAPFLRTHMAIMARNLAMLDAAAGAAALATATELCLAVLRQMGGAGPPPPGRADRATHAAALLHMEQQFANPDLTATSVAAALGCSRSHLYGVFQRRGGAIVQSLRDIRMRRARQLLETTRLPVADVARRSGYASEAAFSRAFRSGHGDSPRAYRARFTGGG